jgi:hypothetical protein
MTSLAAYYFVWESDKKHGVKFEIADDRVVEILAGDETIRYVEGCRWSRARQSSWSATTDPSRVVSASVLPPVSQLEK